MAWRWWPLGTSRPTSACCTRGSTGPRGPRWSPEAWRAAPGPIASSSPRSSSREGSLPDTVVDRLVPVLAAATASADRCHFGLWSGWGDLWVERRSFLFPPPPPGPLEHLRHTLGIGRGLRRWRRRMGVVERFVGACPLQPWWGGRDMILFDGPIGAVAAVGSPAFDGTLTRRSPQWWWPDDRSWFVASEIDEPWSYVAGPARLIEAVGAVPGVESVPVGPDDPW